MSGFFALPLPRFLSRAFALALTFAGLLRNSRLLCCGHACCLGERLRGLLRGLLGGGILSALCLRGCVGELLRGLLRCFLRGR